MDMKIDTTVDSPAFTTKYDKFFSKYSEKYFGADFDWRWFRAQAIAESAMNPAAVSRCGARGLMQVMPATFRGLQRINPWLVSVDDPEQNIAAGVFYDHKLYRIWSWPRPEIDRMALMLASYNAGAGNILKAQKLCVSNPNLWNSIVEVAECVPSWKCRETIGYVKKIMSLMSKYIRKAP
jgi:membrane-bound lytic murein transglycosylase F